MMKMARHFYGNQYCGAVKRDLVIGAYYYPGWHSCPVRDEAFSAGWSEWDLVCNCSPRFDGHEQPNLPMWGRQDDSNPAVFGQKLKAAESYGVDALIFAFYWSRGKRLLQRALDQGFLPAAENHTTRFALMWANRMPRRVLPVKDPEAQIIDPRRLVHTDPEDFLRFIQYVAKRYFQHPNYYHHLGACYLSIFDTNFFLRQLGERLAAQAIDRVREWLLKEGFGELHLAAIDPADEFKPLLREIGFDSVTHYVFLPEWKGELLQDFRTAAKIKSIKWSTFSRDTGLPYNPAVSPGWDASPRALDYGKEKTRRYPWSPIITEHNPRDFERFLREAVDFSRVHNPEKPLCLISSWNEWSEGHYLEPDTRHGYKWLEAVRNAKL